jgi:tripartite-type tricarboxylate transporter receptor subunit TctC
VTRAVMAEATLQDTYRAQGMEPDADSSPAKFQQLVEDEFARLGPIIKSIGLKRE